MRNKCDAKLGDFGLPAVSSPPQGDWSGFRAAVEAEQNPRTKRDPENAES